MGIKSSKCVASIERYERIRGGVVRRGRPEPAVDRADLTRMLDEALATARPRAKYVGFPARTQVNSLAFPGGAQTGSTYDAAGRSGSAAGRIAMSDESCRR